MRGPQLRLVNKKCTSGGGGGALEEVLFWPDLTRYVYQVRTVSIKPKPKPKCPAFSGPEHSDPRVGI